MKTIEAGAVFSSVNLNPLKYFHGLSNILTLPIFIVGLITVFVISIQLFKNIKSKKLEAGETKHIFLIGNIFIYILFFSLNKRLVERWVLPIAPILIIYSTYGVNSLERLISTKYKPKALKVSLLLLFFISYTFYLMTFFKQLNIGDTRSLAYRWTNDFLKESKNKELKILVYTNKGRDPFSNIKNCDIQMFHVYESRDAENFKPKNPKDYDIVVTYSGMENNYKNSYVSKKYPDYTTSWVNFEKEINNTTNFIVLKSFETTTLDLMGLSDIYVYQKVSK